MYGLGAITYFALTGQPPVAEPNLEESIRDGPANPPSEYNEEVASGVDDVVMRALSGDPGDRQEFSYAFKRAFLSAFDADSFETDTDDSAAETDRSPATDETEERADETTTEESDEQAASSAIKRATPSLLGLGVMSVIGIGLVQDQLPQFLFIYSPGVGWGASVVLNEMVGS